MEAVKYVVVQQVKIIVTQIQIEHIVIHQVLISGHAIAVVPHFMQTKLIQLHMIIIVLIVIRTWYIIRTKV